MKPLKQHIYVRFEDGCANVSYIIVNPNRTVDYMSAGETSLAMSNMFGAKSVEARAKFRLVADEAEALRVAKQYARYARNIALFVP